jgi:hypothetical protein
MGVPFRSLLDESCKANAAGVIGIVHGFATSEIEAEVAKRMCAGHSCCQHARATSFNLAEVLGGRVLLATTVSRLVGALRLWYYTYTQSNTKLRCHASIEHDLRRT